MSRPLGVEELMLPAALGNGSGQNLESVSNSSMPFDRAGRLHRVGVEDVAGRRDNKRSSLC